MADNMSQDDFEQKLRELGYLPSNDSQPKSEEENAALQPPVQNPVPSNQGAAEEQANANNPDFETQFPEPTPSPAATSAPAQQLTAAPMTAPAEAPKINLEQTPAGMSSGLDDEALKQAQNQVQNRQLFTGIGDAFATAAAAPSGKAPDETFFKEQMQNAELPVEQIQQRRDLFKTNLQMADMLLDRQLKGLGVAEKQQANDVNAPVSRLAQGIMINAMQRSLTTPALDANGLPKKDAQGNTIMVPKQLDQATIDMIHQIPAAQAKDFTNQLLEAEQKSVNQELRNVQLQNAKAIQQSNIGGKELAAHQKQYLDTINKPETSGGFGAAIPVQVKKFDAAQGVDAIAAQAKANNGKIPPQLFNEYIQGVNTLISTSGRSSLGLFKELLPHGLDATGANIQSYLTGNPTLINRKEWMDAFQKVAEREKGVSAKIITDFYDQQRDAAKDASNGKFYNADPNFYNNAHDRLIQRYLPYVSKQSGQENNQLQNPQTGGTSPNVQQSPAQAAPAQAATKGTVSKDILQQYADKHNITPEEAKTTLTNQGYSIGQ